MMKQLAATFLVATLVLTGPAFAINLSKHPSIFSYATNTNIIPATANNLGAQTDVVSMFDTCLQDDSNGDSLKFNSITGDYIFTTPNPNGFTLSGRAKITIKGSIITLQQNAPDRRVLAKIDNNLHRGTATVQVLTLGRTFTIINRNTNNFTCGAQFFISTDPNDPFMLRIVTLRGETIDYFGLKDQQGLATALTSVRLQDASGLVTNYQFDTQGRPADILAFNGVRFSINWLSETLIQIITTSPDGSIQMGVMVDLTTGSVLGQSRSKNDSPKILKVSYSKPVPPIKLAGHSASNISSLKPVDSSQICSAIVDALNFGCMLIDTIGNIPGGASVLCNALIALVAAIPGGAAFIAPLIIACPSLFEGLQLLCGAVDLIGGHDLNEIRRRLCNHVTPVQTVSFGLKTDFAAGSQPRSVAVGDFNGDGKRDLAVANVNSNTVSILLGMGTGSFGSKTDFSTGNEPISVAVGDFNGDGKLDLAVANLSNASVSILLGTGTGSFGPKTDFGTGVQPSSIAVGDFNGDGKRDLATANLGSDNVSILLGTGAGSFGPKTDFVTGSLPSSLAVGNFNGDGKLDLTVANSNNNTVSILLGTGTGSFGPKTDFGTGVQPSSIAVGDFNGNAKLDLAVANLNGSAVSILLGTGTGSFGSKTDFGTGLDPRSVAVGDFNGDGKLDLAVTSTNSGTFISILLGTGTGSFLPKTDFVTGNFPSSVAVGDFNGDGKFDLAVANTFDNTVSILLNTTAVSH